MYVQVSKWAISGMQKKKSEFSIKALFLLIRIIDERIIRKEETLFIIHCDIIFDTHKRTLIIL
ncbi:hypothetical protein C923_03980 [Plasmodium falciparum UGT5.1]|uniref:Uncharacterized protein n=7 Tax=Plasmodium falciparum TaxID=5833 RepID=W4J1P2_PLAFP|nr:hypothetical protein PFFVO_03523 [Plasmodium falciparum Vietnam Oak-Knoll (FVO)]ETW35377.1 hypothetical protein PFTANZ_03897 [Plasmodium falciparum Tanzania (2000708)]ETW48102.1 hypothetical protein PFMALIP_03809 [Plasmodium falciparum MaliPS096_E11]ETW55944.1 hypothetical protein PFUGPA_01988 [Plasmodium falciparum Palo Alto/Uganda]ETW60293.1 hypothetical protein PFMC_03836 [Plasmodium falciparum CAMP/Malaysia]EUR67991.1 hypothetical protein PFBG_03956 [Plasmodium falciparum 7G8]EWC75382.